MNSISKFSIVALSCFIFAGNCLISNDPVLPVPLNVAVWTSGIPISEKDITSDLKAIFPRYSPVTDAGDPVHDIQLILNYEVNSSPANFKRNYESYILKQPTNSEGFHIALIDDFSAFLQNELDHTGFISSFPMGDIFTLPIVIFNSEFIAKHVIVASMLEMDKELCTSSVLTSVAFIDLSAKACDLTKAITNDNKHIRWATPIVSSPYPFTHLLSETIYTPPLAAYKTHLSSRVVGLVSAAVQVKFLFISSPINIDVYIHDGSHICTICMNDELQCTDV